MIEQSSKPAKVDCEWLQAGTYMIGFDVCRVWVIVNVCVCACVRLNVFEYVWFSDSAVLKFADLGPQVGQLVTCLFVRCPTSRLTLS